MQLTTPQHYLVRLSESLIYYFFLNNDKSLHYNIYSKNNVLLKSEELTSSIIDFSIAVDKHQKIHLICITIKGELLYYINQDNSWSYKTISKFDVKSNTYKHLLLYINDDYTHILCTKTNLLTPALSTIEHIYWNKKNVNRVVIGNYIHGKYTTPLQVSIDSFNNIHIIYKVYYKNNHQLYYNKFNQVTKRWTVSELITNLQEDHSHPYAFIDTKDNLHLIWCTIEQNNFILKYKKKPNVIDIRSKWSNPQILSSQNSNNHSPILIQESDLLKIYCKQNDQIIEIISKDFGNSWTKPVNSKPYYLEDPKIIQYCSNTQLDNKYLVNHIYGNVKDTIRLAGINLFNNKEQNHFLPVYIDINKNQNVLNDTNQELAKEAPLNDDIVNLIKAMDEKINIILSQIEEYESNNETTNTLYSDNKDAPVEDEFEESSSKIVEVEIEQSTDILNELFHNYNLLEKQLFKIEEEKQKVKKTIADYEVDLSLLEEKIVDYKKQMLIFQDKLHDLTSNNSIFQRFINFFK